MISAKEIIDAASKIDFPEKMSFLEAHIDQLFKEKRYSIITEIYQNDDCRTFIDASFEVAYSLNEMAKYDQAELVYSNLLEYDDENTSVLNNLSNIKKKKKRYNEAFELIAKAYSLANDDEIIANNYNSLKKIIEEREIKDRAQKEAAENIKKENDFVRTKLQCFIESFKTDPENSKGRLAIPNWKFRIMMKTDEVKAESLKNQWINKNYIINTGEREDKFVVIYEINPYISDALEAVAEQKINRDWIDNIENICCENLKEISYFETKKNLMKIKGQYQKIILRDYDELSLNYLFRNWKSVIILSGSIIEAILSYYCSENDISNIEYKVNEKTVTKKMDDCDMGDLLTYFEQKKVFKAPMTHLANVSRYLRNYVHPGKEIKEGSTLDKSKADICFNAVNEISLIVIKNFA